MAQINYIADANFHPFSFQERVAPYLMYKDAYEKREAELDELYKEANAFKYLENVLKDNPNDRAAEQYKNYMDQLNAVSDDFSKNGMSISNSRSLRDLRRRYNGEIGQLVETDKELKDLRKKRRDMQDAGKQMLYANENPTLSDLLPGGNFNGYAIDVEDLRKEAAQYAQNVSSGVYSSELVDSTNRYFLQQRERYGYSPELMTAWRNNLATIPEFQQAIYDIAKAKGIDTNLRGVAYDSAIQNIINGIMEGAVSKTASKYIDNPGVLTLAESERNERSKESHKLQEEERNFEIAISGYEKDANNNWKYNSNKDLSVQKAKAIAEAKIVKDGNGNIISGGRGSGRTPTRKAKPSRQFDANGDSYDLTSSNNTNRGKIISYAEAVQKYPAVGQYIEPENADLYDFFDNEALKKVSVIGHPDNAGGSEQQQEEDQL